MAQPFPIKLKENEKQSIYKAAKIYEEYLLNKTINILAYEDDRKIIFSATNRENNFAHLVGLSHVPRKNTAFDIYNKSINRTLRSKDVLSTNGRKAMNKKLSIFECLSTLYDESLTIGKLKKNLKIKLESDLLVGKNYLSLSFLDRDKDLMVINSLLNEDIGNLLIKETKKEIELCCWQDFNKDNTLHVSMIDDRLSGKRMNDVIQFLKDFNSINYADDIPLDITHYIENEIQSLKKQNGKDMFFIERPSLDKEISNARELSQQLNKNNRLNEITRVERHKGEQEH